MVSMNEQKKMIFLYPKTELEQIEVLKKHIAGYRKIIICLLCWC